MMDLLGLLKRLQHHAVDSSMIEKQYYCPECCCEKPLHATWCELKALIDALEAGKAKLVEREMVMPPGIIYKASEVKDAQ